MVWAAIGAVYCSVASFDLGGRLQRDSIFALGGEAVPLQKHSRGAGKFIHEIAERNGWTRDELGDRTIPTAGFEDQPEMTLDYGARQFTLLLDSQLNLVLIDSDRKVLKSLPNPRKDDDRRSGKGSEEVVF
jgi:hypothetical protein